MVKDEVIKLKGKSILMWFLSFVLLFGIVIFIENRRVLRFIKLDYKSEIPLVYITGNENYGYLRGAVFYNKNHYISTSAKLIGPFIQSNIWNSQIQKPNNFEPRKGITLYDLKLPYSLFKSKNNDTVYIFKDSTTLKFLIQE